MPAAGAGWCLFVPVFSVPRQSWAAGFRFSDCRFVVVGPPDSPDSSAGFSMLLGRSGRYSLVFFRPPPKPPARTGGTARDGRC